MIILILILAAVMGLATLGSAYDSSPSGKTWALTTLTLGLLAFSYVLARWPA